MSIFAGLESLDPILLGVIGTLFTWFVTALGAAVVFIVPAGLSPTTERKILDASLGFSAGVMLAASFWSLLLPAIEMGEEVMPEGLGFVPATVGFVGGCFIVHLADIFLPNPDDFSFIQDKSEIVVENTAPKQEPKESIGNLRQRKKVADSKSTKNEDSLMKKENLEKTESAHRMLLLIVAMTIHNFPEGLAVGVAFGSIPSGKSSFMQAVILTIGIGLQNFPEGLAVALPLHRQWNNRRKSFFYGQLSGSVEVVGGFLGAYLVELSSLCLPYALGFAAGAMIFVVIDSIVPESHAKGNRTQATWGGVVGFVTMMVMDVALG